MLGWGFENGDEHLEKNTIQSQVPAGLPSNDTEATIGLAAPDVTPESTVIYTHVRNLSGILQTLKYAPPPDDTPLPFLGSLAMGYLGAHGYDISSILHIASAFMANSDPDAFATQLTCKGLPMLEGLFLWQIIEFGRTEIQGDEVCQLD